MEFLRNSSKELQSLGLVFEPNFFRVFYFTDREGIELAAYDEFKSPAPGVKDKIKSLLPLFALSFTPAFTCIPRHLFEESDYKEILSFNIAKEGGKVGSSEVTSQNLKILYEENSEQENFVTGLFPGLQISHAAGALVEYHSRTLHEQSSIVVHESGNNAIVSVFRDKSLILLNQVACNFPEDLAYYLLFIQKQYELGTETPLILLGEGHLNLGLKNLIEDRFEIKDPKLDSGDWSAAELSRFWPAIYAPSCAL